MSSSPLAVILGACRTPIGNFGGGLKDLTAANLGAIVIKEATARSKVNAAAVDEVIMGCVLQAAAGMNVARQAAIAAGLDVSIPAETVNRVCGSGLQAVAHAVEGVHMGYSQLIVAGGTESMSNAPYALKGARWGYRMGQAETIDIMILDGLADAMHFCHMGMTAEEVAMRFHISRDDQDRFSAESQRRALAAIASGAFKDEIVNVPIPQKKGEALSVDTDEYPRAGTTPEKLAALRPAFKKDGSVTAGNASGINDGAAAVLVASTTRASELGQAGVARVLSYAVTGVEPMIMGIGPVTAVRKAVQRAGLNLDAIHLFELNEAFAAQSIAVVRELGLDAAKVNVNGGAIALGHPIGASGARIVLTLMNELRRAGGGLGIAAICSGGAQGDALLIQVEG